MVWVFNDDSKPCPTNYSDHIAVVASAASMRAQDKLDEDYAPAYTGSSSAIEHDEGSDETRADDDNEQQMRGVVRKQEETQQR